MYRNILAVIAGIVIATLVSTGIETINDQLHPFPPELDPTNHYELSEYLKHRPAPALVVVLIGWAIGSFLGGFTARLITRKPNPAPAYITGLFLMSAGVVTLFLYPYPTWYIISGLLVFIPLTLLGYHLGRWNDSNRNRE